MFEKNRAIKIWHQYKPVSNIYHQFRTYRNYSYSKRKRLNKTTSACRNVLLQFIFCLQIPLCPRAIIDCHIIFSTLISSKGNHTSCNTCKRKLGKKISNASCEKISRDFNIQFSKNMYSSKNELIPLQQRFLISIKKNGTL